MRDKVTTERVKMKRPVKGYNFAHSHPKLKFENSQENYLVFFHKCLRELEIFKRIYSILNIFIHQKQFADQHLGK